MTDTLFAADAGILLHPTSLPGDFAVGDLGPVAHAWLQRLADAGQTLWQVLPLHPIGLGDSPYQATSAMAGDPLLISPEALGQLGLLTAAELAGAHRPCTDRVDYAAARTLKRSLVQKAHARFLDGDEFAALRHEFDGFTARAADWLGDYALYEALRASFRTPFWTEWPEQYRDRDPDALVEFARDHAPTLRRVEFEQFVFDVQWRALVDRAHALGIRIVGDLPIFVAHGSVDVWTRRDLFDLEVNGAPRVVAGVPPDYFSATGQLWGSPLYRWERHREEGFAWWLRRVARELEWADVVRIDHFRGLEAYWEVPAADETAVGGRWVPAPGRELLTELREIHGLPLPVIAEDLGLITDEVTQLRDDFGLPGIRVLQFAFGADDSAKIFLPEAYVPNCVAYTGTHDNDTTVGWFSAGHGAGSVRTADEIDGETQRALAYLGTDGAEIHWDFIEALHRSRAGAVIVPLQDVLGLGSDARMNVPGTASDNWRWRLRSTAMLDPAWARLAQSTKSRRPQ